MPAEVFPNNAQTVLSAAVTSGLQATVTVTSAATFPATGQYRILIDNEYMLVISGQGTNTWGVTRGVEGTTATTHLLGAPVVGIITNAGLQSLTFNPATQTYSSFAPTGSTGAVAPTRYVGGTTGGAPTVGSWMAGDFVIDLTGYLWICTVGGVPGTWKSVTPPPPVTPPSPVTTVTFANVCNVDPSTFSISPTLVNGAWFTTAIVPASGKVHVEASVNWYASVASQTDAFLYVGTSTSGPWFGLCGMAFSALNFILASSGTYDYTGLTPGSTNFYLGFSGTNTIVIPAKLRGASGIGNYLKVTTVP